MPESETREIIVVRRQEYFHACLRSDPTIWGCGKSYYSAVADMIWSHQTLFGLKITVE